jgi:hypothetical protein
MYVGKGSTGSLISCWVPNYSTEFASRKTLPVLSWPREAPLPSKELQGLSDLQSHTQSPALPRYWPQSRFSVIGSGVLCHTHHVEMGLRVVAYRSATSRIQICNLQFLTHGLFHFKNTNLP